jgi:RNA polymerase sigma factor (sigma-70 family)
MRDLARAGQPLDPRKPDPLDVPDDGDLHLGAVSQMPAGRATSPPPHEIGLARVSRMMGSVTIPPFETFYAEHNREVLGLLRRKLGRDGADDAFQETFLRALRAYDRLDHGEHLRAWVLTIASRVAIDVYRRTTATAEVPELPHEDERPAYEDLGELTDGLPPKERAAVVLRYGYDLTYEQIAAALDSSPDAARQAASTGVRRLRKEKCA